MEKAYFGMDTLRVTNGPHGNNSHKNSWAIDLGGEDAGISRFYAPFTGVIRRLRTNSNEVWFESSEPVQWADGTQDYVTILMIHANSVPAVEGQTVKQGEWLYNEGTKGNATGNHIHFEVGKGKFVSPYGWYKVGYGDDGSEIWNIYNQVDPTKVFFLKPTCNVMNAGTDNTSGAALQWKVDDGTTTGNLEANTYFTVSAGNLEYFTATDVYTNVGYLEREKSYIAYDSYVGTDFTWWRFRHPDGNLYWCAMLWDKLSAYGTLTSTELENKVVAVESETSVCYTCDPFDTANAVLVSGSRTKAIAQANLTLYDKTWIQVELDGEKYWVPLGNGVTLEETSYLDNFIGLPKGSTIEILADSVYYYQEPNPSMAIATVSQGTVLTATKMTSTGVMGYNWYEALLEDGSTVYIVINNDQVKLTKGDEEEEDPDPTPPPEPGSDYDTLITGIDVSKYQYDINWDLVKGDPQNIQFAIIRAVSTRDANAPYVDEYLIRNMQGAQAANIPYGIYIYTYGETESEINTEVDLAISQLEGFNPTYPVAWDFEADCFKDTSKKEHNTDLILYALRRIQNRGYHPLFYTYYNMIKNYCNYQRILDAGFDIWIADYRGYNGFANEGGKCTIWQYSSSGSVNGINGRVDMDEGYFDYHRYITDHGLNNGAISMYPSEPFYGYVTLSAGNVEAFPYPSVYAEGNYYLMNGASYSVVGKCTGQIEGLTWYLIKDNNLTRYMPFMEGKMTLTEGNFITSQYRFYKTTKKTWISNYETMEYFDEPNVNTQLGYMVKDHPYEVFGTLVDTINSNGYDYTFVIIKSGDNYYYCCDFSKDNKCYLYESDIPYPLDQVKAGSMITTDQEWIGYYDIPTTYDNEPKEFLNIGKKYEVLGKVRYQFDKKTWIAIDIDGTTYYVMDDGNIKLVTNEYDIPYTFDLCVTPVNLEICAASQCYDDCNTSSSAGTYLDIDRVYNPYAKINDSSVSGEWYVLIIDNAAKYVQITDDILVYTGTPYQRTEISDICIIPNASMPYYDVPTTSEGVSTVKGYIDPGTIMFPFYKINRTMVGGTFYVVRISDVYYYVTPSSVESYCGGFDLTSNPQDYGYYLQASKMVDLRMVPHHYAGIVSHLEANTRITNPMKLETSVDGNEWWSFIDGDITYYFIKDDSFVDGYFYTVEDVGSNFYCTSEKEDIIIYSHCDSDPSFVIASSEAPASLLISGKVVEFTDPAWYTIIMPNGTTGYICANEYYTFDYVYSLQQLPDYAYARVSQSCDVYARPDEKSDIVRTLDVGEYPVEWKTGNDEFIQDSWLMLGDNEYIKVTSTTTLVYIYPKNVVSKYLRINVIAKEGLKAYVYAETTSANTTILYGTQVDPMYTFEANGHTWYTIYYGNGTYYVLSDDPNMALVNVYDSNPCIEGWSVYVVADVVDIYKEPDTTSTSKDLLKGIYPLASKLTDEINGYHWYSLIVDGETYYIQDDLIGVDYLYWYDADAVETGWYIQPLVEDYYIYDNPVDPQSSEKIDMNVSIEIDRKLKTTYNGQTWYEVFFNDMTMYAPVNSDKTNARVYNKEDEETKTSLKEVLEAFQDAQTSMGEAIDNVGSMLSLMNTFVGNMTSHMQQFYENLTDMDAALQEATDKLEEYIEKSDTEELSDN